MQQGISAARALTGPVRLPGDKSISHRYAMLGSLAEGATRLRNFSSGADCASTLGAVEALGIRVERAGGEIVIHGRGLDGWREPSRTLDAGNSGSTIRMMSGLLAGQPFESRIAGDESLSRRPMDRIIRPLGEMGAGIDARDGRFPPLHIHGRKLRAIDYTLPVASAQVKTCVLFAGLFTEGATTVREPVVTRDHTERALREMGAEITVERRVISLRGRPRLKALDAEVPGDLSSAAFFLVAATVLAASRLEVQGVGLNPTRSALIDFLLSAGANVQVANVRQANGELVGDLLVTGARPKGGVIEKAWAAALIDEIPVLAVMGAASEQGLAVRDAAELRVKETDRIATLAENFRRMGVSIEVRPDGFDVPGGQKFHAAEVDSFGDHRIAMACAVAGLLAEGETLIQNAEAASVSFPEFWSTLQQVSGGSIGVSAPGEATR
jgi:3-phosphoshikimate 1-carboxyvinyltransferase